MEFTIRDAVQADNLRIRPLQDEIALLHYEGNPAMFRPDAPYLTEEAFAEKLSNPEQFVWIAENEAGEIVGYVFACVMHVRNHPAYWDFDRFYVDTVCVAKAAQHCGVGTALMEKCKAKGRELGCALLDLGVHGFNRGAIAFYEKCGLTEQQRRMEIRL